MSHQTGYSPAIGMQPRPRRAASDTDPHLAFMLAHQATNHLRLEMRSLAESVAKAKDPAFARYETDIAISQCEALKERIRPFATFIDQAIRFEAQEILAALDSIRQDLAAIDARAEPPPQKGAAEIAARLMGRRN